MLVKDFIELPSFVYEHMVEYCESKLPEEACGLFIGTAGNGAKPTNSKIHVERFIGIPNIANNPQRHFNMDPSAVLKHIFPSSQSSQARIVGIVHSHPLAAPIPSSEDLNTLWTHIPSHWIVSFQQEPPDCRAYRYTKKEAARQAAYIPYPFQIVPSDPSSS